MAAKKTLFQKIINGTLTDVYPKTSALCVYMDSGDSVETTLGNLGSRINALETALADIKTNTSVYILDSSNNPVTDDDGTGLVEFYSLQHELVASNSNDDDDDNISTY
mgnify:CR=1 FL=1